MNWGRPAAVSAFVLLLIAPRAGAQSAATASIAGVVRDATGAVLPGVTVEAASPALIEKVRVAVTDDSGNYKIIELRPGAYSVTFTLPGFAPLKREGLELTTGFTAVVNADLKVGGVDETIVVTGASPVVDVQNVRTQAVLSQRVLDELPTGKALQGLTALTLGAVLANGQQDVGGNKGEQASAMAIHGGRGGDSKMLINGLSYNSLHGQGGGQFRTFAINTLAMQETTLELSGISAESETGGVQVNFVPKEGGNTLRMSGVAAYTNGSLHSDNLSEELRARGLREAASVKQIYDWGADVGGRIVADKLWFYQANRWWGAQEYQPSAYFNATLNSLFYTPDLSRRTYTDFHTKPDSISRLTWQAAAKHKLALSVDVQKSCACFLAASSGIAPEASTLGYRWPEFVIQGSWNYPASNRLLFDVSVANVHDNLSLVPLDGVAADAMPIVEIGTAFPIVYHANGLGLGAIGLGEDNKSISVTGRASVSYVTGAHALKAGLSGLQGWQPEYHYIAGGQSISYLFLNRAPIQLTQYISPFQIESRMRTFGAYAHDQWTIRRLTLNLGLRFDALRGYTVESTPPQGRFTPAGLHYPAVDKVPSWKDISPRGGIAYDLFGNGKTALKGTLGRYIGSQGIGLAQANHPGNTLVNSASRQWTDANGNFVPDCDLMSPAVNAECGPLLNSRFGTLQRATFYADDVLVGWGARPFSWQASAVLQQELRPGVGVTAGYYRTWYGNFTVTQNRAVTPSDFDPFCVSAPSDTRLPDGGSHQVCGLFDVTPARVGLVNNLITQASNFGDQTEVFNGVDVGLNARFGAGGFVQGGLSVGRTATDNCAFNERPDIAVTLAGNVPQPREAAYCHVSPPWSAGTQAKVNAIYPLPWWGIRTSVTYQNLPGAPMASNLVATNAQVAPSLGRNLAGSTTATVALIPPLSLFEERLNQLDVRLTKVLQIGRTRVSGMFDVYNLFNADTVLASTATYGPAWLRPSQVLGARLFKVGAQFEF